MQLTVQRADLARAMIHASRVVERRNTIPILASVMLDADADGLRIRASDLDMEITIRVDADVASPGSVAVDAQKLADIAKKVGGDAIAMALDESRLTVKSGRSRVSLPTLPTEDFPSLASGAPAAEFDIDLASVVAPVAYAQSTDATRYYLNGVYLHAPAGELIAVATDGHRLARRVAGAMDEIPDVILPTKFVSAIPKGEGRVALSKNTVRIEAGDITLMSKLIDGTFPDYQRVVPSNNPHTMRVRRANLKAAVELAMSVSDQMSRAIRFDVAPGSITVSARSDGGDASQEIEAEFSAEPMTIGFNGQYVIDTIAQFDTDEVEFRMDGPASPVMVSGGGDLSCVIMPMRVV